jgi:hypothetical protein
MIEAPMPCADHIDLATLSAWRDRALTSAEYRQLTEHVAVCPSCQYRLRAIDRIGQSLQLPDTDEYQERIWRGLQARMRRPAAAHFAGVPRLVAAISVLVIIALFALLAYRGHFLQPEKTMATATIPPTLTPLPAIWQSVPSVSYAVGIAFATNDLQTGYVCGNPASSAGPMKLGVTHDAGLTWTTSSLTEIRGGYCKIYISPYDALDVVLEGWTCSGNCLTGNKYMGTYRSGDGGKTWTQLVLPPGNEASGVTAIEFPVWTPAALFVLAEPSTSTETISPEHAIAVSINGDPLTWTTENPITPIPANPFSIKIFTTGNSINFSMTQPNSFGLTDMFTSQDNGATWVHSKPQGLSPTIGTLRTAADRHTLVGVHDTLQGNDIIDQQAVFSTDGGKTWSASSAFPKNSSLWELPLVYTTLDGSMFVALTPFGVSSSVQQGIYKLAPRGTSWVFVAPLVGEGSTFVAVSGDSTGLPKIVWEIDIANSPPTLEFHPIR